MRDLWLWTFRPLALLAERARTGDVFGVRLWRRAVVGYRPDWNRAILGDTATFRSRGSLSGLTPYLSGGVVAADAPDHGLRREQLNPHFHRQALTGLVDRLRAVVVAPRGEFEALAWSARTVRHALNAALFGDQVPDRLLAAFLAPLHRRTPAPLLPRPALFARVDAAIAAVLRDPPPGTLAAALAGLPGAAEELRIALAAGYDTTAHTLAFALWHLAHAPEWLAPDLVPRALDEVQRLYPAGWIGSRVAATDATVAGVPVRAGTLLLYSPYLTHRDPALWSRPTSFLPGRFDDGRPAWGFLPFAAGRRTCLGAHLARLILTTALAPFAAGGLRAVGGDPTPVAGLTLRPRGPLVLRAGVRAAG